MSHSQEQKVVTLAYYEERFRFLVAKQTEDVLRGFFVWTDREKSRLHELTTQMEEAEWYLDERGYRLADTELFEKSAWSVMDREVEIKAIQRFMDWNSGEAWFCLTPWVRIADEFNRPSAE